MEDQLASQRRSGRLVSPKFHSQMKVLVEDVALWRLLAASRTMPYGWIEEAARACGVTAATVTMAIGGQNWAAMTDPPPVGPSARWAPRQSKQSRPVCPACRRRKYARASCRDPFHTIDHRATPRSRDR